MSQARWLLISIILLLATPAIGQRLQSEYQHDTALAPASTMVVTGCEAKDFDGAALPRAVSTEGDAVRCAATLSGVPYVMLVSEDGSLTIYQVEDAAHVSGHAGIMPLGVRNDTHTTALSGTDGDYTPLAVDSTGKVGIRGTFAEDAAHTSADLGVFLLCVRNDAGTALAGTDLDYIPCTTDASGRLRIAAAPANSGVDIGDVDVTSVVPGTGATNLGKPEDGGHTTGDVGVMALTVRQNTAAALAGTDADYQPLITDSTGRLHTNTELPDAAALADNTANPTVPGVGAFLMCWDGATWDRCPGNSAAGLFIQGAVADGGASGSGSPVRIGAVDADDGTVRNLNLDELSADAMSVASRYGLNTKSHLYGFNGTTADRIRTGIGATGTGVLRTVNANNDPCQTSGIAKSSVVVNVTADAQLVALSGTTIIYVCGFSVSISGTTPTMRLISGTGSVCATGLTGRTGAYIPLTGSMIVGGGGAATILATAAGEALCMDVEGTSPSVQGYLSYVQQ